MSPYYHLSLIPECDLNCSRELKMVGLFSCSYRLNVIEQFDNSRTLGSGRGPIRAVRPTSSNIFLIAAKNLNTIFKTLAIILT